MAGKHDSDEVFLSNVAMPSIPHAVCAPQETNTQGSIGNLARSAKVEYLHIFKYFPNVSCFSMEKNTEILCTDLYIDWQFSGTALPIYLRRVITLH